MVGVPAGVEEMRVYATTNQVRDQMRGIIRDVTSLADRLKRAGIHFDVSVTSTESIMFSVAVPGEHWEIELMTDGTIEIEVFCSNGEISDESKLDDLFDRFAD